MGTTLTCGTGSDPGLFMKWSLWFPDYEGDILSKRRTKRSAGRCGNIMVIQIIANHFFAFLAFTLPPLTFRTRTNEPERAGIVTNKNISTMFSEIHLYQFRY